MPVVIGMPDWRELARVIASLVEAKRGKKSPEEYFKSKEPTIDKPLGDEDDAEEVDVDGYETIAGKRGVKDAPSFFPDRDVENDEAELGAEDLSLDVDDEDGDENNDEKSVEKPPRLENPEETIRAEREAPTTSQRAVEPENSEEAKELGVALVPKLVKQENQPKQHKRAAVEIPTDKRFTAPARSSRCSCKGKRSEGCSHPDGVCARFATTTSLNLLSPMERPLYKGSFILDEPLCDACFETMKRKEASARTNKVASNSERAAKAKANQEAEKKNELTCGCLGMKAIDVINLKPAKSSMTAAEIKAYEQQNRVAELDSLIPDVHYKKSGGCTHADGCCTAKATTSLYAAIEKPKTSSRGDVPLCNVCAEIARKNAEKEHIASERLKQHNLALDPKRKARLEKIKKAKEHEAEIANRGEDYTLSEMVDQIYDQLGGEFPEAEIEKRVDALESVLRDVFGDETIADHDSEDIDCLLLPDGSWRVMQLTKVIDGAHSQYLVVEFSSDLKTIKEPKSIVLSEVEGPDVKRTTLGELDHVIEKLSQNVDGEKEQLVWTNDAYNGLFNTIALKVAKEKFGTAGSGLKTLVDFLKSLSTLSPEKRFKTAIEKMGIEIKVDVKKIKGGGVRGVIVSSPALEGVEALLTKSGVNVDVAEKPDANDDEDVDEVEGEEDDESTNESFSRPLALLEAAEDDVEEVEGEENDAEDEEKVEELSDEDLQRLAGSDVSSFSEDDDDSASESESVKKELVNIERPESGYEMVDAGTAIAALQVQDDSEGAESGQTRMKKRSFDLIRRSSRYDFRSGKATDDPKRPYVAQGERPPIVWWSVGDNVFVGIPSKSYKNENSVSYFVADGKTNDLTYHPGVASVATGDATSEKRLRSLLSDVRKVVQGQRVEWEKLQKQFASADTEEARNVVREKGLGTRNRRGEAQRTGTHATSHLPGGSASLVASYVERFVDSLSNDRFGSNARRVAGRLVHDLRQGESPEDATKRARRFVRRAANSDVTNLGASRDAISLGTDEEQLMIIVLDALMRQGSQEEKAFAALVLAYPGGVCDTNAKRRQQPLEHHDRASLLTHVEWDLVTNEPRDYAAQRSLKRDQRNAYVLRPIRSLTKEIDDKVRTATALARSLVSSMGLKASMVPKLLLDIDRASRGTKKSDAPAWEQLAQMKDDERFEMPETLELDEPNADLSTKRDTTLESFLRAAKNLSLV